MNIKAALLDLDGTLVTVDLLDIICSLVGKGQESAEINEAFLGGSLGGLESLIKRLNLVTDIALEEIESKLKQELYLREGAKELVGHLRGKNISTILHSGHFVPVLELYRGILGIDYVVGTQPNVKGGIIYGISSEAPPQKNFKLQGCKAILDGKGITSDQVIALGDSPADRKIFEFAAYSIAVAPKGGIERYADKVIGSDLREAITVIDSLRNND